MTITSHNCLLNDDYSVRETTQGSQIFATIPGENKRDAHLTPITLDDDAMQVLAEWYFDGCCPVCGVAINDTEIVCDSCFAQAKHYRDLYGYR